MPRLRRRDQHRQTRVERRIAGRAGNSYSTPPQICKDDLGPVVYFIRCDDGLIKIGYTTQLHVRRAVYGKGWDRVLAVMPGTMAHEKACHALHHAHLAKGREYFHPHPDLLAHINEIREHLNVPLLDFEQAA
jgi:hypothetical protein